ncbi:hypothetical protein B0H13DRAFT_1902918 [Mycena leptocephala]|nr:hypothetical protein B0H13DRAFT_1902918 [Mycena leptocephala]
MPPHKPHIWDTIVAEYVAEPVLIQGVQVPSDVPCACGRSDAHFWCTSCESGSRLCRDCVDWTNTQDLVSISLHDLGLRVHLGHDGQPCPRPDGRHLILISRLGRSIEPEVVVAAAPKKKRNMNSVGRFCKEN